MVKKSGGSAVTGTNGKPGLLTEIKDADAPFVEKQNVTASDKREYIFK